jgi:hypothetical protein
MADGGGVGGSGRMKGAKADDLLADAKDAFTACETNEAENREEALDDIRFARLGEQWPDQVRKRREKDGRPCQTINVLPTYIRQVVNDGRQNRPQINVHPQADGADEEVADVYNGLIRNIEASSNADVCYDTALDSAVTHGWGYYRINTEYATDDSFLLDLCFQPVFNPFAIWADPHSQGADSADWNLAFVTERILKDEFERKYKGAEPVDWQADYVDLGTPWIEEETVLLAEYWTRDEVAKQIVMMSNGAVMDVDTVRKNLAMFQQIGLMPTGQTRLTKGYKVTQHLLTGAEIIDTVDWPGRYIPIVPVYGEVVNLEGRRYLRGLVRDAKDSQQSINFMRTAAVEAVGYAPKAPFIGPKGAFATDADKWDTANVETHAYIEYDGPEAPQRQPFPQVPQGYIQAANDAASDLKSVIGMFQASLGQPSNETSGRAILARMREGDVSTFHYVDNLARAIRHGGRILIDLIPKIYDIPRMIRVLKPDGSTAAVQINQPFQQPQMQPNGQPLMRPVAGPPGVPPGPPGVPPGQPGQPPQMGAPPPMPGAPPGPPQPLMEPVTVEKIFDLTAGKYDLTVEAGPSFTTRREEAANQMIELARADPAILPLIGDILVKNLDWPGAEEIAQRLDQARQAQSQQGPDPKVQAEMQAKAQQAQAEQQQKAAQAQADNQLAMQQMQMQMQLEKQKMEMQMDIERQKMLLQNQLNTEKAQVDARLAEQSMKVSAGVKIAEAKARIDQTVEIPEVSPGGDIG